MASDWNSVEKLLTIKDAVLIYDLDFRLDGKYQVLAGGDGIARVLSCRSKI